MVTNDEREKADLRAEIERWRDKAQEAGAAYGNANSKHHAELDRANRLERLADTLAGKAVDLEDRARAAEAKVARVEAALAVLDEVAYGQIAVENVLTILPTGPHRAYVPAHWEDDADERAQPFRDHIRLALDGDA